MKKNTIYFKNNPVITSTATIIGPKEGKGVIARYADKILNDDMFEESTYEKAECKMLTYAIDTAIKNGNYTTDDINALFSGDLLNQIISSNFAARDFDISFIGLYGACSTFVEAFAVGAAMIDGGYFENIVAATGSHFSSAERQYRYPLELGCTRPPQAQWTVTGAGGTVISKKGKGPKITCATFGKVMDYGVIDANNLGAAMAPAAMDTIFTHFKDTGRAIDYYDLILTGDLGALGSKALNHLLCEKNMDISHIHMDCGNIVYEVKDNDFSGGSGAGCSAVVFNSYIFDKIVNGNIGKILFVGTGALLSTISTQQGESIPCVAHAVCIER